MKNKCVTDAVDLLILGILSYLLYRYWQETEAQKVQVGARNIQERLREARDITGNTSERGDRIDQVIN